MGVFNWEVSDMKKSQIVMGIGIIVFSFSVLLSQAFGISSNIIDFSMGFGIGIEIVGVILIFIENRKK